MPFTHSEFFHHQKVCGCVQYYVNKVYNRLTDKDLHDSAGNFHASEQVYMGRGEGGEGEVEGCVHDGCEEGGRKGGRRVGRDERGVNEEKRCGR